MLKLTLKKESRLDRVAASFSHSLASLAGSFLLFFYREFFLAFALLTDRDRSYTEEYSREPHKMRCWRMT